MTGSQLKAPTVYAEWASLLDKLKNKENDAEVLEAMQKGSVFWQSSVAQRFAQKLIDTINSRLNGASDQFQKHISQSKGHDGALVNALLCLRKELAFLFKVADLPALSQEDRRQYTDLILRQADKVQASLEDSAKKDRSGKMSSIVRNHKVNAFNKEEKTQ